MPKRAVYELDGKKYIILPYTGFRGQPVWPEVPYVAVPFFENVSEALLPALERMREYEATLQLSGVTGIGEALSFDETGSHRQGQITYVDKIHFPFLFFRGECREEHGIMPTLYRFLGQYDASTQDQVMHKRRELEREQASVMHGALHKTVGQSPTDEQARATARHFGAISSFLDFTFDPRVAAFFAHPGFLPLERDQPNTTPVGIIYCFHYQLLNQIIPMQAWTIRPDGGVDIRFINVMGSWSIPYLAFNRESEEFRVESLIIDASNLLIRGPVTIRIVPVPQVRRIVSQQALFIEMDRPTPEDWRGMIFLWYLLDFACEKWCFRRFDHPYEDREAGVTGSVLLPQEDAELEETSRTFAGWKY